MIRLELLGVVGRHDTHRDLGLGQTLRSPSDHKFLRFFSMLSESISIPSVYDAAVPEPLLRTHKSIGQVFRRHSFSGSICHDRPHISLDISPEHPPSDLLKILGRHFSACDCIYDRKGRTWLATGGLQSPRLFLCREYPLNYLQGKQDKQSMNLGHSELLLLQLGLLPPRYF